MTYIRPEWTSVRKWEALHSSQLQNIFNEASSFLNEGETHRAALLELSGEAEEAMSEIFRIRTIHRGVRTAGGTVTGGGAFVATASVTAPFLGPLCVFAGAVAAIVAAVGTNKVSHDVNFEEIYTKHGKDFVEEALKFTHDSKGKYHRAINRYPDYGRGDYGG